MQRPQGWGVPFASVYAEPRSVVASCAMGAAYEGAFGDTEYSESAVMGAFPELSRATACPVCGITTDNSGKELLTLVRVIEHLNDGDHLWTREQIADWLDSRDVRPEGTPA